MSKAYVEIDFFEMEKKRMNAFSKPSIPERAHSSFQGIQSVVSRINPQLLRTVMAAGADGHARPSDNIAAWATASSDAPSQCRTTSPPRLSRCNPASPLTIFYNGGVITVDVPRDKAEAIMRMAETGVVAGNPAERSEDSLPDGNQVAGVLPIARRKSLQRFLEKRKERLAWASPCHKKVSSYLPTCPSMESCTRRDR